MRVESISPGHEAEMRRAQENLDLAALRRLWAHVAPGLPQPKDDREILATAHLARTQAKWLAFRHRAYSHGWLIDNGLPSGLPDELKPRAQRLYPVTATSVGVLIRPKRDWLREPRVLVARAMNDAVEEVYADRRSDDIPLLKRRMLEARDYMRKKMFGSIKWPVVNGHR